MMQEDDAIQQLLDDRGNTDDAPYGAVLDFVRGLDGEAAEGANKLLRDTGDGLLLAVVVMSAADDPTREGLAALLRQPRVGPCVRGLAMVDEAVRGEVLRAANVFADDHVAMATLSALAASPRLAEIASTETRDWSSLLNGIVELERQNEQFEPLRNLSGLAESHGVAKCLRVLTLFGSPVLTEVFGDDEKFARFAYGALAEPDSQLFRLACQVSGPDVTGFARVLRGHGYTGLRAGSPAFGGDVDEWIELCQSVSSWASLTAAAPKVGSATQDNGSETELLLQERILCAVARHHPQHAERFLKNLSSITDDHVRGRVLDAIALTEEACSVGERIAKDRVSGRGTEGQRRTPTHLRELAARVALGGAVHASEELVACLVHDEFSEDATVHCAKNVLDGVALLDLAGSALREVLHEAGHASAAALILPAVMPESPADPQAEQASSIELIRDRTDPVQRSRQHGGLGLFV